MSLIYCFNDCELDQTRVILRRDGVEVHVEPQVFDLLFCLLAQRGQIVLKEQLLDEVWGDRFVSDSALTTRIKSARQAVGDDGTQQKVIRTVHGRGYEFVAEVVVLDESVPFEASPLPEPTAVSRVPAALQSLIGRDVLLGRLREELSSNRLVTLVGPGGVGKTSVGYELARSVERDFADGVCVIELVTVTDEGSALEALATALEVNTRQKSSIDESIIEMLRSRTGLLLLDNCEHLVDSIASLVHRIMRVAPGMSIIATSREPLAIAGEHVWRVEPLPTADSDGLTLAQLVSVPAIALFVERATAADPAFEFNEETAAPVTEICRRLDGIPLAIELAASRARSIDVEEIASRLDERFRILKAVRRASDPRHQTLHDAISWSYDLLTSEEQEVFTALAVFAGQFNLEDAESVCPGGDVLDQLTRLTERSMLAVRRPASGGTRYELLETLREYGRSRLDENQLFSLSQSHASHLCSVAQSVGLELQTPSEREAVTRADGSFADLRSAQRFALQAGDIDTASELIGSIREYAMRTLRYEVFAWADAASAPAAEVGRPADPTLIGVRAYGAWVRGEFDEAVGLCETARSAEGAGDGAPTGLVERVLANVHYTVGHVDLGWAESVRLVEIAVASGNRSRITHACYMAAVAASYIGDYDTGNQLITQAREAAQQTGSPTDLASVSIAEGFSASADDRAALDAFASADRLARSVGNRWMSGFARTETSGLLLRRGDLVEGCRGLAELVDLWFRAGEWSHQWTTLSRCVIALDKIGQPELAAEAVGAIEAHATLGCPPVMVSVRDLAIQTRESLTAQLGEDQAAHLHSLGASRPVADVVLRTRRALLGLGVD